VLFQSVDVVIDPHHFVDNFLFDSQPFSLNLFIGGLDLIKNFVYLFVKIIEHPLILIITLVIDIKLSLSFLKLHITALGQPDKSFIIGFKFRVEPFILCSKSVLHNFPPLF
jgi:hypothetical protein